MQIVFAAFTAIGGLVAALAGAYGLRQTRRIAASGHFAIALVKPAPPGVERPLLQYETEDGRVMEIVSPVPLQAPLESGSSVRLSYDPEDPRDVVLDGHARTRVDKGFVIAGLALVVIALVLAVTAL
ncbi:hypothetical protein SLUN_09605 [Streptomyces lunaelactis]|uniref:DUF3592 domain-containing protein n=1 Tax=Streptomyces lunaelactis TaxID=1535768 RepID=A0A2R4SZY3_9ACTN|nr:DUF3592 domain-containing protein [Streptomyces lunaelactis]AVZ72411.1 hypothetical protein SLUN_09605 [Streptomyces lunaelactis]NUK88468.1 hypothetical protein [Streptomyces lunaelactis]NUL06314.1 hypothetical protein [Streptomyces lunaelactis]